MFSELPVCFSLVLNSLPLSWPSLDGTVGVRFCCVLGLPLLWREMPKLVSRRVGKLVKYVTEVF